jgi:predicted Zn-dependent protease
MSILPDLEPRFHQACDVLLDQLRGGEALALAFAGEASDFMRFNQGRVRQAGHVLQARVRFTYYRDGRTLASAFETTGDPGRDREAARLALDAARREAALLPEDPWQALPSAGETSRAVFPGRLPERDRIPDLVLGPGAVLAQAGADFVGLHTQGLVCRGAANSAGARHWFAAETFVLDWSAWLPGGKAVKSGHAGRDWDPEHHARRLAEAVPRLEALARPERTLAPGAYRVYLAPEAVNELVPCFSWNGLGERGLREGESSFLALREGRRKLSPRFSLVQDFSLGVEPRFNAMGEAAPERLPLIEAGELVNTVVSARTARQYGVPANAGPDGEEVRSPAIGAGVLDEAEVLETLGTGLYLSNLHYLNWSDRDSGRITGMTRFACFRVEHGALAAPVKDMRFDESIYHLFGDKLAALTRQRSLVPETGTYDRRALGGALLPGMLVEDFTLTL